MGNGRLDRDKYFPRSIRSALLLVAIILGLVNACPPEVLAEGFRSRLADEAVAASVKKRTSNQVRLLPNGKEWVEHLENDLMPFWLTPEAIGTPEGNFPTFRANNGSMIDPNTPPIEFTNISSSQTWIKNKVNRQYARMMGRQIFAYCVAFHLTGKEKYLNYAKKGTEYLLENMKDPKGGFYTWIKDKKGYPEDPEQRISQDIAYTLMGPAMYYYLTRDPQILKVLLESKDYIFSTYRFPNSKQLRWVVKNYIDPDDPTDKNYATQKELVAQLDQINAYMLLTTGVLDGEYQQIWLKDMVKLATSIKNDYYNKDINMFWGCIPVGPVDPLCTQELSQPHVDYGHTIKTFWMMYLIGTRFKQPELSSFAKKNMPLVFKSAFDPVTRTWREKPRDEVHSVEGNDRIWWVHDELDQAAATLALIEPAKYVKYLVPTYKSWFFDFVDPVGKEVWHGLTGPLPGKPMFLKAHLWKNAFHDTEHALIGYITSQALQNQPVELYYAFNKTPKKSKIQPYILEGTISKMDEFDLPGFKDMKKYKVTFRGLKP